jgi:hypothetical protein
VPANANLPNPSPPAQPRWRLWVDGSGGYLLLTGNSWSVGGLNQRMNADVCVRADWASLTGHIERAGNDYFWRGRASTAERILIRSGQVLPIPGSASIILRQPSPLCDSAVLQLKPPHRFDQHVDGVVLVNETLLVGPTIDCHIRCRESSDRAVIARRGDKWVAKAGLSGDFEELCPGRRMTLRTLAMTLEKA